MIYTTFHRKNHNKQHTSVGINEWTQMQQLCHLRRLSLHHHHRTIRPLTPYSLSHSLQATPIAGNRPCIRFPSTSASCRVMSICPSIDSQSAHVSTHCISATSCMYTLSGYNTFLGCKLSSTTRQTHMLHMTQYRRIYHPSETS